MRPVKTILIAAILVASMASTTKAETAVVASIKPLHSLVAAVMEGVGVPGLLVEGAGSPHTYSMKPSQARMLQSADVVFWIGHDLETFLKKPLETLAAKAKTVELIDAHDLAKLEFREGGAFEAHDHAEVDDHAHKEDDHKHKGDDHKDDDHKDHDHKDDHDDHGMDPHVWLDPVNAKALVHEIAEALVAADPGNAAKYEANAKMLMAKLDALIVDVSTELEPVKSKGFVVFHDAYHYFEKRFGLKASGTITVSPESIPGARRVVEIREKIGKLGVACVFAEPQFEPKLVSTVLEGSNAKSGVLDPLGASLKDGPNLYFELIREMAGSFKTCLGGTS